MKRINIVLAIFFSILVANGQSGSIYMRSHESLSLGWSTSAYESWEYRRDNSNGSADYLPFRMLKPLGYDQKSPVKYPLIMMLHGRGEAGWGNEKQLRNGGKQHLDAVMSNKFKGFVVFPQEPWGAWSFNNPEDTLSANQLSAAITQAWDLLDSLVLKYNVDPDRIIIHGLSSGGTGTLVSMYHRPDLFAAALPMSAAATVGSWESPITVSNVQRNMGIVAPIPVWWFQGGIDDNPPTSVTDVAIGYLRDSGATNLSQSKYTIYSKTGHSTWNAAYAESDFFPFILRQNKRQIYVMGNNPICCGKGTDLAISKGFYQYQWFKDGVEIPGATTHKLRNITSAGKYHVRFVKRSGNGLVYSDTIYLTEGSTPPVVSLVSPTNNASYIAPASVSMSANASDVDGSITKVDFYQGNTLLFSDLTTPYQYTWNSVAAGSYTIKAVATDNSGTSTTSSLVNVTVGPAVNQAPVVSLTSPSSGLSFAAAATINLTATASDPDGTIAKVNFYNGSTLLFSDGSAPYSYAWSGIQAGNYTLSAIATDNLGATKTSSTVSIVVKSVVLPTGKGLTAEYFNNATLNGKAIVTKIDQTVNFKWSGSPTSGINSDKFSVRWSGKVLPAYNETYTFYTKSDDGVRLYVNNVQIVNNWTNHSSTENSGKIALKANQQYDIRLEYYDNSGTAEIRLSWSSTSQSKSIVPKSNLYPNASLRMEYASEEIEYVEEMGEKIDYQTFAFPQPALDLLYLNYQSFATGMVHISLVDQMSNIHKTIQVEVQEGSNTVPLDVTNLKSGVYILVVRSENKKENIKFIKQ